MKINSSQKILIAFILNLFFSLFELIGGIITGSVAIMSDSIHDFGDSISIGLSYLFEKKSKKKLDSIYTYGYSRYSVVGSLITTIVLIVGSLLIIVESIKKIITPNDIDYNKMILFAIVGVIINTVAALITVGRDSLNQKAVNLHMIEDVLGWIVVLVGAIIMKFTHLFIIDPILSITVSMFVSINAIRHCKETIDLLLEKSSIDTNALRKELLSIPGIDNIHHLHVWNIDHATQCATLHAVSSLNQKEIKNKIRQTLCNYNINHVTIELESKWEHCPHKTCNIQNEPIHCSCCSNH